MTLPAAAQRVDVPVKYMRVLSRVELGSNWDQAVALQKKVAMHATGQPALPTVPKTVMFDIEALPGVEAFDSAELALDSEADINPGMETRTGCRHHKPTSRCPCARIGRNLPSPTAHGRRRP